MGEVPNALKFLLALSALCGLCHADSSDDALRRAEPLISRENFPEAEQILKSAAQNDPANVELLYRLGYVRYRQRKLPAARAAFTAAVKASPSAWYSMYFLGQISLLENKAAEAVRWLQPVVEQSEPVFDSASRLAAAYAQTGEIAKAEVALRSAIGQTPWDGSLYFRLGQMQRKRGLTALAQESFSRSSRLRQASREDVEVLMAVAQKLRDGQYALAFEAGHAILRRPDADPGTLVALGGLFGSSSQHREALESFEVAAGRDPRFFAAQLNRGLALLRTSRPAEAAVALDVARSLLPQSAEACLGLGLSYVMQGRHADAVEPLEQAWRLDPGVEKAGALLATVYLRTNSASKAVALLQAESMRKSADAAPSLLLVDALTAAQDLKGALQAARAARTRFPNVPQIQLAEAQVLVRLGQYGEAQHLFRQAVALKPDWPEAHVGLGDCLQKGGEHDRAITEYRTAVSAPATSLAARLGLARSLMALRQFEEAQSTLEATLRDHPSEVAVRVELSRVYARLGRADLAAAQARAADELRTRQTQ